MPLLSKNFRFILLLYSKLSLLFVEVIKFVKMHANPLARSKVITQNCPSLEVYMHCVARQQKTLTRWLNSSSSHVCRSKIFEDMCQNLWIAFRATYKLLSSKFFVKIGQWTSQQPMYPQCYKTTISLNMHECMCMCICVPCIQELLKTP